MTQADDLERYMLGLINEAREDAGASALLLERNLNTSAEAHSIWMLEEDIFSHTGVGGSSATLRMADAGFDFSGSWRSAENIAIQSERGDPGLMDDVLGLHTSLMNSSGHRANILNPALQYVGIGIELGNFDFSSGTFRSVIVTQNFASTQGRAELDNGATGSEPSEPVPGPVVPSPTTGSDELVGTDGHDTIKGLAGNDSISGGLGKDLLYGHNGSDILFGGVDHDTIKGGWGADELHGESGNDQLFGADGNDTFFGGDDSDTLSGGNGHDRLDGGDGDDLLKGQKGTDDLRGQAGADLLFGNSGDDILFGGTGRDTLVGGYGADLLNGEADNDRLVGAAGDDTLSGGAGNDTLIGKAGADTFVFNPGWDADVIVDFETGADTLDLRGYGFASTSGALSFAAQQSSDVHFDFGSNDHLIIRNITLVGLADDLLI